MLLSSGIRISIRKQVYPICRLLNFPQYSGWISLKGHDWLICWWISFLKSFVFCPEHLLCTCFIYQGSWDKKMNTWFVIYYETAHKFTYSLTTTPKHIQFIKQNSILCVEVASNRECLEFGLKNRINQINQFSVDCQIDFLFQIQSSKINIFCLFLEQENLTVAIHNCTLWPPYLLYKSCMAEWKSLQN